jgi:hypothetical protein
MGAADPWFLSGEERNLQEKRGRKEERTPGRLADPDAGGT